MLHIIGQVPGHLALFANGIIGGSRYYKGNDHLSLVV
jgi:hypothetical protein